MTENRAGTAICDSEFDRAYHYAERKLTGIIAREGDADGARREEWYLVQLIHECLQGFALSEYCRAMSMAKQKETGPRLPASEPVSVCMHSDMELLSHTVAHTWPESKVFSHV